MEKTLEQLQAEFAETFGKEVPVNKKNDAEWIASKIAEAKKAEEENQTVNPDDNSDDDTESEDGFKEDEDRFNTEEDDEDESDEVVENEDYDDNSVDNQVMTQEARKVGDIVYPV